MNMSVICITEYGWLIDHQRFLNDIYSSTRITPNFDARVLPQFGISLMKTTSSARIVSLNINKKYFAIHVPFFMDSQIEKKVKNGQVHDTRTELTSDSPGNLDQRTKKRKRKFQPNANTVYHEQIKDIVSSAIQEFIHLGRQQGTFTEVPDDVRMLNNKEARMAASNTRKQADSFAETLSISAQTVVKVKMLVEPQPISDLGNTIVHYSGDIPCILPINGHCFVLPQNCSFYMADILQLPELMVLGQKYDFIVMDCPWMNKSVKRKKRYCVLQERDILHIPFESLSNDGCIIAVWVTNNQTLMRFIKEELFPAWNVTFCAIWHWVKVTVTGEVICDLDSHHKKPYEHIIIGQKCENAIPIKLQNNRVICSVPSSIHSHKPPLQEVFQPYLKKNSQNLELFARYLLPGWTSWGNEVLLLQHLTHFEVDAIT